MQKYLKYKTKYLREKNVIAGGCSKIVPFNKSIPSNEIVPSIELYEFELKGYPSGSQNNNIETTFGSLSDSPTGDCGIIHVTNNESKYVVDPQTKEMTNKIRDDYMWDENRMASCDSLLSNPVQQGGDVFTIQDFYDLYKILKAREQYENINPNIYKDKKNEILSLIDFAAITNKSFIEKNKDKTVIPDYDSDDLNKGAMIYKINVTNNDKIIIFGDFHGSYHTFLRHMLRLYKIGIIDMNTFKVRFGYKIIFLGDILDRGMHATEILLVILNLIKANNTSDKLKVILNRGNHEEISIATDYGFKKEISKKLGEDVFDSFMKFMATCPSALILENTNIKKRYWLSHGGIPLNEKNDSVVKLEDKKILWFSNGGKTSVAYQIRWNDFFYDSNKFKELSKGRSYKVYPKAVEEFLRVNDIEFIIRGHQDFPFNSYLLCNKESNTDQNDYESNKNAYVIGKNYNIGDNKIIFKNKEDITTHQTTGPIARISINGKEWFTNMDSNNEHKIFPVLTLTTNTDISRPLKYDSFAILRFDLSKEKLVLFDKDTNILDTRNKMNEISEILKL